jgi:hypothetical protein
MSASAATVLLVVAPGISLGRPLADELRASGFEVERAEHGPEAIAAGAAMARSTRGGSGTP